MEQLLTFVLLASSAFLLVSSDQTTWQVEQQGRLCVLAEFNADINITYWAEPSSRFGPYQANSIVSVPSSAVVSALRSFCDAGTTVPTVPTQDLVLTWPAAMNSAQNFNLTIRFKNNSAMMYQVEKVSFEYDLVDVKTFPLAMNSVTRTAESVSGLVTINKDNAYQCLSREEVALNVTDGPVTIAFSNVKVEAFRMGANNSWYDPIVSCHDDLTTTETTTTTTTTSTTTVAPGPQADWWVQDKANTTKCVLASFVPFFNVQYTAYKNATNETYTATALFGSDDAKIMVDGMLSSCVNTTTVNTTNQLIKLNWTTTGSYEYSLSFLFEKMGNGTDISHVVFMYDLNDAARFPGAVINATFGSRRIAASDATIATIDDGMYLRCNTGWVAHLKETKENLAVLAMTFNSSFEAFRMSNTSTFDDKEQVCPADLPTSATTVETTMTTEMTSASTTPTPGPKAQWMVKDPVTGDECVLASLTSAFMITYNATNTQTKQFYNRNTTFNLPDASMVSVDTTRSFCNPGTTTQPQRIVLTWKNATYVYNLTLDFMVNNMSNKTEVSAVALEYDLNDQANFPEATIDPKYGNLRTAESNGVVVSFGGHMYLKCDSGVPASLTEKAEKKSVEVTMHGVKLEAFRMSKTDTFDDAADVCPGDLVPTTTPFTPTTSGPINLPTYKVKGPDGEICLMATFGMTFDVKYYNKSGTTLSKTIPSVNNGSVNDALSYCTNETAMLVLDYFLPNWTLEFNFTHNPNTFTLSQVILSYNLLNFPDANDTTQHRLVTDVKDWSADLGKSFVCKVQTKWMLNTTDSMHSVEELDLELGSVKLQAFMVNGTWGAEQECAADGGDTSEIVPIAVGCALAALVIIVLIAYVIGRRRNRARGYESM